MAISQMKKIAILFSKEHLDELIDCLQSLQIVEIQDLRQIESWQKLFDNNQVKTPKITMNDSPLYEDVQELHDNQVLDYLDSQEGYLEKLSEQLRLYLPHQSTVQRLRTKPRELSFSELKELGESGRVKTLAKEISLKLHRLEEIENELECRKATIEKLEPWETLDTLPTELAKFHFLKAKIGILSRTSDDYLYKKLTSETGIQIQELFVTDKEYGLLCFYDNNQDDILNDMNFVEFDYSEDILPRDKIKQLKMEAQVLTSEKELIQNQLINEHIAISDIKCQIDYIRTQVSKQITKTYLASNTYLTGLQGWVEEQYFQFLQATLFEHFGQSMLLIELDSRVEEEAQIPIKLENKSLIEPFELLTEMYALPGYYEKDPTPILAPFYFTFFGMMVADLGYGILLYILTLGLLKIFYLSKSVTRFLKFFNILSISVGIWGIIYGSFFGYELPFHLISTTTDVMTILILSVVFGFMTVVSGLFLGGMQKLRKREYGDAYTSGFAWCFILVGLLFVAIGSLIRQYDVLAIIGKWLAICNAGTIIIVSIVQARGIRGIGKGIFNLYNISSYVGDLVSFTRLMALGLSGASIGSAFNLIVGLFPGISKFTVGILIFTVLHTINIFLSLLSGYVHGARLIFVELFGKFYEGGGRAFSPLKTSEKYIHLKQQSEEH